MTISPIIKGNASSEIKIDLYELLYFQIININYAKNK